MAATPLCVLPPTSPTKSLPSPVPKMNLDTNVSSAASLTQNSGSLSCLDAPSSPGRDFASPHPMNLDTPHLFLTCGICREYFKDDPKLLSCLHSFCESCLQSTMLEGSLSLSCATCKVQSIIPPSGISGLQTNFYAVDLRRILDEARHCAGCVVGSATPASYRCTECGQSLCSTCSKTHALKVSENQETGESKSHNAVAICKLAIEEVVSKLDEETAVFATNSDAPSDIEDPRTNRLKCPSHNYEELSLYCSTCETGICSVCADRVHFEHATETMSDAIEKERAMMREMAKAVDAQVPLIRDTIDQVNQMKSSLAANLSEAENKIEEAFDSVVKSLKERRDKLLREATEAHEAKEKVLKAQRDALEAKLARMLSCCELTMFTLENGSDAEILLLHKQLADTMDELASLDVNFTPEENYFLGFSPGDLPKMRHKLSKAGCVVSNSCIAHETVATGEGLKQCVRGKVSVVIVTTKNHQGELVTSGNAQFETYLQNSMGKRIIPEICDNQNGTYDLGYLVNEAGSYVFVIKLYGHHIKGSPFKLRALSSDQPKPPASPSPIKSAVRQRAIRRPLSAAFVDQRKSDPVEDDLIFRVGVKGRNKSEFTSPQGLCAAPNSRILVSDATNQNVQVFTNSGDYRLKFGIRGRQPGQFQRPTDVAVTLQGNFLVSDHDNKWISIHAPDGKFLNRIGVGKLLGPKGIAVDSNGHVIVVDNKANSIFVFQSNGKMLLKFGSRGTADEQLNGPYFVTVNAQDEIVVSDFHNHRVKVFDSQGAFRFAFGSQGEGNGQFNAPTGVAVDAVGNIVVADWGNSRIQLFDKTGSFLSFVNTEGDPLYGPQALCMTTDGHIVVADTGNHCFKVYRYLQ